MKNSIFAKFSRFSLQITKNATFPTHKIIQKQFKFMALSSERVFSSTKFNSETLIRKKMEEFNDLFVEARDEIEYANESQEMTYFNDEVEAAKLAVKNATDCFEELLKGVEEKEKQALMRANGLKVEQLKQELEQLLAEHHH
mmetsp:Transcript_2974/g.4150  ORF Transcript_2974/g.4150 Transcript_2974/m.4150 type:complete len:142 (-) Transcript_2974:10-435(-)